MEEDIKKAFDDLFYKIVVNGKLNLNFIKDLINFCDYFIDHKDFAGYRIKAKSDMSRIYYHHKLFEKSFDIDFEFLQENPVEHLEYFIIIGRISKTSSILMRTDEVKEYVNKFILNENGKHIFPKLHLLDWYAFHYPQEIEHNDTFDKFFSEIVQTIGAPVYKDLTLTERVKVINNLNNDGADILYHFRMAYQHSVPELRPAVLEEFMNETPLKFYQNSMKNTLPKK